MPIINPKCTPAVNKDSHILRQSWLICQTCSQNTWKFIRWCVIKSIMRDIDEETQRARCRGDVWSFGTLARLAALYELSFHKIPSLTIWGSMQAFIAWVRLMESLIDAKCGADSLSLFCCLVLSSPHSPAPRDCQPSSVSSSAHKRESTKMMVGIFRLVCQGMNGRLSYFSKS